MGARGPDWGKLFRLIDRNHSGDLSRAELKVVIRTVFGVSVESVPDTEIDELFETYDGNKSGTLDLKELEAFLKYGPQVSLSDVQVHILVYGHEY